MSFVIRPSDRCRHPRPGPISRQDLECNLPGSGEKADLRDPRAQWREAFEVADGSISVSSSRPQRRAGRFAKGTPYITVISRLLPAS